MRSRTLPYERQAAAWPARGNHILAQHDESEMVVYQAFKDSIAEFAVRHQGFGGEFSFARMSWIKPGFLWMMYRSGWATKEGQERVLAIHLRRQFFDRVLSLAVETYFRPETYESREAHRAALNSSQVRLQWDPDHDPSGKPLERRAIQLGLKGEVLKEYAKDAILEVEDMTAFVEAQRPNAGPEVWGKLLTPEETAYTPTEPAIRARIHLDPRPEDTSA